DPRFRMIKGRGGALLREKIVASSARRRVTIITSEKQVDHLGATMPLPVEVSRFGLGHTGAKLARLVGPGTPVRLRGAGSLYETDGGNAIIDCRLDPLEDPEALERSLRRIPGVLDTGFFFGLCDILIVGYADRVDRIEARAEA